MAKKVAVIRAGASGLISLKCCVDEGLAPTCFERTEDIGGLWKFKENVEDGLARIYQSVITNTSKEMSCFSDFPMSEDFPNFLHNSILEYFRIFAKKFDLLKYIQFQTTVLRVIKCPDFSSSGQWEVVTESKGKEHSAVFDAVLVCNGHHFKPHLPLGSFPGIERFKGQYFHSCKYKKPEGFDGKHILVIGLGNSAADTVAGLSTKAAQVHCSLLTWYHGGEGYLMKEFVVNDDLPSRILYGAIKMKSRVVELTETSAIFEDGTVEEDVDVIVFATGYTYSFLFLDSIVKVEDNMVSLYKYMFPPHLEKSTLACIGLIQPLGSIFPTVVKLQACWATRVFKVKVRGKGRLEKRKNGITDLQEGLCTLPSERTMMEDIIKRNKRRIDLFGKSESQLFLTNYINYLDDLATEIGAKPDLLSLLFRDPKLAVKLYFGPCSSYQYRLEGPGKWEGARSAILSQEQRLLKPLKTRAVAPTFYFPVFFLLQILGLLAVALTFFQLQWY
ncbi:LOW QUALITY PROTEIN: dimethylaniline monooxygenase [N-oxide-forming] 2-like [Rhynchonycteris naso]